MTPGYEIVTGADADLPEILALVEQAFGSPVEAELVRLIYESPHFVPELFLLARAGGRVIGQVMLSYVELEDGAQRHRALTLSPIAVAPDSQNRGVGAALIAEGLRRAGERGEPMVLLEGSPHYYGRLGFEDSRNAGIVFDLPDWAPPNAGQIYKLKAYDSAVKGKVRYPPAFAEAERLRPER